MPPCQRKLADNATFSWRKVQNQQPLSEKLPASSFWKSITFFCGSGNEPNVNCTSKYSCDLNSVTFENFLHFLLGLQKKYFTILWRHTFLFPQIIICCFPQSYNICIPVLWVVKALEALVTGISQNIARDVTKICICNLFMSSEMFLNFS